MRKHSMIVSTAILALAYGWPSGLRAGIVFPGRPVIKRETTRQGDWRLDIARNPFSGAITCRLAARNGRAFYQAGAVGFRFNSRWNVTQAVYRIDQGDPIAARDDLPQLIQQSVPLDRGGMDNAGGGIVWIPLGRLSQANSIAIAPRKDRKPVTFHVHGLEQLHDIAVDRGCKPESVFVER